MSRKVPITIKLINLIININSKVYFNSKTKIFVKSYKNFSIKDNKLRYSNLNNCQSHYIKEIFEFNSKAKHHG